MVLYRMGSFSQIGTPSTISRKAHLHIRFALIVLLYDSSSIKELCCIWLKNKIKPLPPPLKRNSRHHQPEVT
ncbi:hypothetical protein ACSQ67_018484 [Phaseolus vulgaris]